MRARSTKRFGFGERCEMLGREKKLGVKVGRCDFSVFLVARYSV